MKKALIAMSGGVDSSVCAYLTKQMGYDCMGVTMKLYENEEIGISKENTCCSLDDVEDARSVAHKLDMPYYVLNFTGDFKEKVIMPFVNCYLCGMTPNPCIECNRHLKFDMLYKKSKELGCDKIVTGHYARIEKVGDKYVLKKAVDESKDQSYVLYNMNQELLAHTLFPLGDMSKADARKIASENGFINAGKHDSQDICFVPDGDYAKVVNNYAGVVQKPGNFVDVNGNVLGEHKGIIHYTVGQRKGLGIAFGQPMYVKEIRTTDNTVVLATNEELFSDELYADDFNWISGEAPDDTIRIQAKIRYRHTPAPASAMVMSDGKVKIVFDKPQRAITKGQAVVIYDGDIVVGGGTIV